MTDFDELLGIVHRMATRLARSRVPGQDMPTWTIAAPDYEAPVSSPRTLPELCGNELYQGRAGIGLALLEAGQHLRDTFLADLGTETIRAAARGALDDHLGVGFYSGISGVAWAAGRAFELTGDLRVRAACTELLDRALGVTTPDRALDVIGGSAGAAVCGVHLFRRIGLPQALELALRAGDTIVKSAEVRLDGWAWSAGGGVNRQPLCGYAHGVAGFVHALLELHQATGDAHWLFAAQRGMAYEGRRINLPSGDLPDFRDQYLSDVLRRADGRERIRTDRLQGSLPTDEPGIMRAWCHGAPGALPVYRLAQRLQVSHPAGDSAIEGLEAATRDSLVSHDRRGMSLCHGVSGNAWCLLESLEVADRQSSRAAAASDIASAYLHSANSYERDGGWWPSGVAGQIHDPSLMVGDSGIMLFLLAVCGAPITNPLFVSSRTSEITVPSDAEYLSAQLREVAGAFAGFLPACRAAGLDPTGVVPVVGLDLSDAIDRVRQGELSPEIVALLDDAMAPDAIRLELDASCSDARAPLIKEYLAAPTPPGEERSGSWQRADPLRMTTTTRSWRGWAAEATLPPEQGQVWVAHLQRAKARTVPVRPVHALILEVLADPRSLDDLLAVLEDHVDTAPEERIRFHFAVATAVRSLVDVGLLVRPESNQ